MLQRIPVIVAVTAASYGLQVPQQAMRWSTAGISHATRAAPGPSAVQAPVAANRHHQTDR